METLRFCTRYNLCEILRYFKTCSGVDIRKFVAFVLGTIMINPILDRQCKIIYLHKEIGACTCVIIINLLQ